MTADYALPEVTYQEAEEAVLGAILTRGSLIDSVQAVLQPHHFESQRHRIIYTTMVGMQLESKPIEFASIVTELKATGQLDLAGGRQHITMLLSSGMTREWRHYAELIRDSAGVRRLREFHLNGVDRTAPGSGLTYPELLDITQGEMNDLADESTTEGGLEAISRLYGPAIDSIEAASKKTDQIIGVPSGFTDLDLTTTGFLPGQMIVIAARPGFGKSTLGLDIARHASLHTGVPTAFFSLEMSKLEIMIRLFAAEGRIDMGALRAGRLGDEDWEKILHAQAKIASAPMYLDDTPNITMADIKAKARRMKSKRGLGLIVIDYLQLLGSVKQHTSREQEVSATSRNVKLLAKELGVPVIVMAQLNRGSETRAGGKPILADLRESGAIEQDADMVMFIHREDKVDETSSRVGEADIVIAKQRNGPTKTIPVGFQGHFSRFTNISYAPEPNSAEEY